MPSIFISHTHGDRKIAEAIDGAISTLLGNGVVDVVYSTKRDNEGGIPHGADWFDWIVDQVKRADIALVLLTPGSVQKPWVLWEAGAVEGVAMALSSAGLEEAPPMRKVRPIRFNLDAHDLPSPFHRLQILNGTDPIEFGQFFKDLTTQYKGRIADPVGVGARMHATIDAYIERVSNALLTAPLMVTEAAVSEWLVRLDEYRSRPSEVRQLQDWLNIAFGRGGDDVDRPIDLRIHRRLGELYASLGAAEFHQHAARQFELARQLAPRDIFILRQQGSAYINTAQYDLAEKVIGQIEEFDSEAFTRSAECAALRGKLLRKQDAPDEAAKVYGAALQKNKDSYYLANLAAEASLEAGKEDNAREFYRKSLEIIERVAEKNVWALASALNACLALGEFERAKAFAASAAKHLSDPGEFRSVESGVRVVASRLPVSEEDANEIVSILKGGLHE